MSSAIKNTEGKRIALPPKPAEPCDEDCCGNGCIPCVFDIYEQECKIWERKCSSLMSNACESKSQNVIPLKDEYSAFRFVQKKPVNNDCYVLRFETLQEHQVVSIEVSKHIILKCEIDGQLVTRQYSPIVVHQNYFEVIVKIYKHGKMSGFIESLTLGTDLEWRGSFGQLDYIRNKFECILMLAAGTGIAPMFRLIQQIVNDEQEDTRIRLIYSNKTYNDILLKHHLDEFKQFWNFTLLYVLTQEMNEVSKRHADEIRYERINENLINNELRNMFGSIHKTLVIICGTRSFETDMLRISDMLNLPKQNVFKF